MNRVQQSPICSETFERCRQPLHHKMWLFAVAFITIFAASCPAQVQRDLGAFAGRWRIDLSRTTMNRMGPAGNNLVRSPTFTFVFAPTATGLQMNVYPEYPGVSTRATPIIPDQKLRPCTNANGCQTVSGDPADQTFVYYQVDGYMIARIFYIRGKPAEYTTYAVSTDLRTFTMITWSAETPEWQNIQVFDKQP